MKAFEIHLGVPEMKALWDELKGKNQTGKADAHERKLYRQLGKAMALLASDPRHPGLQTHEIPVLTVRYGMKVWQSYLENNTPRAGRIYWVYGPSQGKITVIGLEPHPDDKANSYKKITLSRTEDAVRNPESRS